MEEHLAAVLENVKRDVAEAGFELVDVVESPIKGAKGNVEMLGWLRVGRAGSQSDA